MADKEQLPVPVAPARGARAGVRADVNRAKEGSYNPVGTGTAWSHNFLNQKPWHPLNFRNQVRKYEAEQRTVREHKAREQAMAEWQAEQEKTATLAFLSPAEAKRQKDRASISFLYTKPPGLEAALARDREAADKAQREKATAAAKGEEQQQQQLQAAAAGASSSGKPPLPGTQQQQKQQHQEQLLERQRQLDRLREDPFAAILTARCALQKSDKFVLRVVEGAFGGTTPGAENQLLLGDEGQQEQGMEQQEEANEVERLLASLDPEEREQVLQALDKKRRKEERAARLKQAQELLRSAGLDPEAVTAANGERKRKQKHKSSKHSSSKHKKPKKSHKKASRKHSKRESDSSDGSDEVSNDSASR